MIYRTANFLKDSEVIMISLYFSLLLNSEDVTPPTWLPDLLSDASRYELVSAQSVPHDSQFAFLVRKSDDLKVMVTVDKEKYPDTAFALGAVKVTMMAFPPDGNPLGQICEILNRTSHLLIRFKSARERITVTLQSPQESEEEFAPKRKDDFTDAIPEFVAIAREAAARFSSRRAGAVGQVSYGGQSVETFVALETGVTFVNLDQYTAAMGHGLNKDNKKKSYRATVSGINHLIHLGTMKVKKGNTWQTLEDHPMLFDDKIWVPVEALKRFN